MTWSAIIRFSALVSASTISWSSGGARGSTGGSFMVLCMVMPNLKKPIPNPPVERPVRGFSDCKEGGSFGALRSLGLVGVARRDDELNGWAGLVGVVLVVLAQENNFIVGLAGGVLWP